MTPYTSLADRSATDMDVAASTGLGLCSGRDSGHHVRRLSEARRIHDRLDWWRVDEWFGSDAWTFTWEQEGALHETDAAEGALLIVPSETGEARSAVWRVGHSTMAWLRWGAVADGKSASGVMRRLFARAVPILRSHGVESIWVIADATDWISPYLADAGFVRADRMLTYQIPLAGTEGWASEVAQTAGVVVRPIDWAQAVELEGVIALDAQAFDEPWRYGPLVRRAAAECPVFVVAMADTSEGSPVGYACALCNEERAHVVRLAVASPWRGRRLGTALLTRVADAVRGHGARILSLNTQQTNTTSHHLYTRLGFHVLIEQPYVHRLSL